MISSLASATDLRKCLGPAWVVISDYVWTKIEGHGMRHGQVDYILFHPSRGLLMIKIVPGQVHYASGTGWELETNGQWISDDPLKRLADSYDNLLKEIKEGLNIRTVFPYPYGMVLLFPDVRLKGYYPPGCSLDLSQVKVGRSVTLLWDRDSCVDLTASVEALMSCLSGDKPVNIPGLVEARLLDLLQSRALMSEPSLRHKLDEEEAIFLKATAEQVQCFRQAMINRRLVVEGVAGSGKSLLALEMASRLLEQGKRVLMLTFNRKIAAYLRHLSVVQCVDNIEQSEALQLMTFHDLASQCCAKAGLSYIQQEEESAEDFWVLRSANLLLQALEKCPELRWDAVLVDEAQDFRDPWWPVVEAMLVDQSQGYLLLFCGPEQNMYHTPMKLPVAMRLPLVMNCRNTRSLANFTTSLVEKLEVMVPELSPLGVAPELIYAEDSLGLLQQLDRCLMLLREEGVWGGEIMILGGYRFERTPFSEAPAAGGYAISPILQNEKTERTIHYSTIRSAKGLEASVIILWDMPEVGSRILSKVDFYVACTRARSRLIITTTDTKMKNTVEKILNNVSAVS